MYSLQNTSDRYTRFPIAMEAFVGIWKDYMVTSENLFHYIDLLVLVLKKCL